jgi:acetylornithine deacetylase/succinyl-diaminopimelate desuccinylase-like protein
MKATREHAEPDLGALVDGELDPTLELLARLVSEPSTEGSDAIGRCLDLIADELEPMQGRASRPQWKGPPNLVVEWGDAAAPDRFLLTGHADIVPAEGHWTTPPFTLVRRGDLLLGRGVCDMKGALAAFVGALKVVFQLGKLADAPVSLVITGDEETGSSTGMVPLLEERVIEGATAICGEPTDLDVYVGNRGVMWLHVEVRGHGGHAGMAEELANPLLPAAEVVRALSSLGLDARDERFQPATPSLTATTLRGDGDQAVNVIPDTVTIGLDRRLLPGEDADEAFREIERVVAQTVASPFEALVVMDWTVPPYIADAADPLPHALQAIVRDIGREGALGTDPAADDSSWLGRAGISTVLCGPGEPAQAHTTDEALAVADLRDAIEIYARLVLAAREGHLTGTGEGA